MQREEKQLESALQAIIIRVNDLKNSIQAMITKIETEYETINWPTFLDNYALLSGHLTGLSKILQAEMAPALRSLAVLPLQLGCERDEALVRLTEGRVPACTHNLVPDLLRTKPEPEAEKRLNQLMHKASSLNFEVSQKQVAQFNKVVSHIWEIVSKGREDWEGETQKSSGLALTHHLPDTHALVTAVGSGKGLRGTPPTTAGGATGGAAAGAPGGAAGGQPGGRPPGAPLPSAMTKPPSAIKTNIKAATQIHPYQR